MIDRIDRNLYLEQRRVSRGKWGTKSTFFCDIRASRIPPKRTLRNGSPEGVCYGRKTEIWSKIGTEGGDTCRERTPAFPTGLTSEADAFRLG